MDYTGLIRTYRNKYPYLSFRKLADLIVKEEKLEMTGHYFRKFIPDALAGDVIKEEVTELELPESMYEERPPFILPKSNDNILVVGDGHVPFHDGKALNIAFKHGKDRGINAIVMNGDMMDFYAISRFIKKPNLRNFPKEVEACKQFLRAVRNMFPKVPIYYKLGNHEERYEIFIAEKAPELFGLESIKFQNLFDFDELGITLIDNQRVIEAGKLNIIHGHEAKMFSGGVNVARAVRLKAIDNILTHHFHRYQDDTARTIKGKVQGGFSVGCLCGLSPDYMPLNNWSHGFAIVEVESDGCFNVDNKKIINGLIK